MPEAAKFRIWSFFPEVAGNLGLFVKAYLASVALGLIGLATPLFFQAVIDKAVLRNAYSTLIALGIGILIAVIFDGLFSLLHDYLVLHANPKIEIRLAGLVFKKLLSLPISFFEGYQAGSLSRDIQQVRVIRDFMTGRLFFAITELTALIVFVPVLFCYSPGLTAVVLGFSSAISGLSAILAVSFRNRSTALYHAQSERQALLVETLHGIATVKAIGLEPVQQKRWEQRSAQELKRTAISVGSEQRHEPKAA
jgi:subfamily B ATP-binding cassette protein HlyB/CyaB